MKVNDIFYSIQGEGIYTGLPMNFIRLQGCNLYPDNCCRYCDTRLAQNSSEGTELSVDEILAKVSAVRSSNVCWWYCITGGEPLFQVNELSELVRAIKGRDANTHKIEIETNGTLPPPNWFSVIDSWVVDIKCPSAGEKVLHMGKFNRWLPLLRKCDQVKFVVGNLQDLEFVQKLLSKVCITTPILISPIFTPNLSFLGPTVDFVKEHNLRLSLQYHKFIGVK